MPVAIDVLIVVLDLGTKTLAIPGFHCAIPLPVLLRLPSSTEGPVEAATIEVCCGDASTTTVVTPPSTPLSVTLAAAETEAADAKTTFGGDLG